MEILERQRGPFYIPEGSQKDKEDEENPFQSDFSGLGGAVTSDSSSYFYSNVEGDFREIDLNTDFPHVFDSFLEDDWLGGQVWTIFIQ